MTRIARRRILGGVAAGLLATSLGAAVSGTATAAPVGACTISTLPYPTGTYRAEANAVDPTGRFVAGAALRVSDNGNQNLLLVWDRNRLTTIESSLVTDVIDVNAGGVVVGNGWVDGIGQPWRYRDGRVEQLPVVPSAGIFVTAINKAGDIVGHGSDVATGENFALRWPAARPGTVEVLDAPAGAAAQGITANGTIVGNAGEWGSWSAWVRRPNGRIDALGAPGARTAVVVAAAGHWAVGQVDLGGTSLPYVRWDLRDGSYTAVDGQLGWVTDVNNNGVVVGGDRVARGATSRVLPGGDGAAIGARSISDTGTIVGFRNDDRVTPVRWTGC
ncbi:hypothetical protein JNW91_22690 [Micromonospora sp. STR1_7]|uniref:Uncharacterized protein n=1 Tax=Micromonospora parastrephiae TaxID=2806101 RepID=A0ABS1XYQ1_9ACTN|nr:hypothetical protein [Micromonospora parastrephiae]MBM0234396.1 hypothetical protein [Micromonospora parastrephiae]